MADNKINQTRRRRKQRERRPARTNRTSHRLPALLILPSRAPPLPPNPSELPPRKSCEMSRRRNENKRFMIPFLGLRNERSIRNAHDENAVRACQYAVDVLLGFHNRCRFECKRVRKSRLPASIPDQTI
ncbi:hypothetical protein EVAR_27614_1 [Eumeta japonica]|uniref:Uncharacterized protein n=1 Tax=Eumeta variegata TaxID=151549 RepID=A0A4C1V0D1_EUMVA|nr:hypothetical protein EVAR_27614_1 [Eumeta japonica]